MGARMKIELQPGILLGAPGFQRHRRANFRHPVTPALFAGGDGDLLPLLALFVQTFTIQFNAAALREQWRNEAYTQFDRFLDSKFHFFTARHHLAQMDMQRRFTIVDFAFHHLHFNAFLTGANDFSIEYLIAAVKQL